MNGPEWICDDQLWPTWDRNCINSTSLSTITEEEIKSNESDDTDRSSTICTTHDITIVIYLERFNSYQKLLRVTAYVTRFIQNCRRIVEERNTLDLTPTEIRQASMTWIRAVQHKSYVKEIECLKAKTRNHLVRQLRLYLDDEGLIRCGERINNAPILEDAKYPILLHRKTDLQNF